MFVTNTPERSTTAAAAGIFPFDHPHANPPRDLVDLLGGKGAGLAEMTSTLKMNVPPGFTLGLDLFRRYTARGWDAELDQAVHHHVERLAEQMGRHFGDARDPLLVAVRSGAPISMPGMLDTVLNLGLNDDTVEGLAAQADDSLFAWDSYRRFVHMYATTVRGLSDLPCHDARATSADAARAQVVKLTAAIAARGAEPVPHDPYRQLREAIEAVFASWNSSRAVAYRAKENIAADLGTAVNVQAMVFGNRGDRSGTGVLFTRNPSTGVAELYGDYLPCAQGEDVVAGTAATLSIHELASHLPHTYDELTRTARTLETHYRDLCDIEFTIEDGRLWILQTRIGQRSPEAAVRIAVDLVADPIIALTSAEALARVDTATRARAREAYDAACGSSPTSGALACGLAASPGRVSGRVVLTSDAAADSDDDVILVRKETSPEDVAGMAASVGILTTRGGLVSHAAVVARGWGLPAVVGTDDLTLDADGLTTTDGRRVSAGDMITIDGSSGHVWIGVPEPDDTPHTTDRFTALETLEAWAEDHHAKEHAEETTMKIAVERDKCTALGICESIAPDFFEVDDNGELVVLREDLTEDDLAVIDQAVAGCPTAALRVEGR